MKLNELLHLMPLNENIKLVDSLLKTHYKGFVSGVPEVYKERYVILILHDVEFIVLQVEGI